VIARGVVLALVVAACGKGHGLLVQTETNVELFVAMKSDDCAAGTSCPITPPLATDRTMRGPTRLARRWLIADTTPIIVDATGGWLFEADGNQDQTIAALLGVETDSQGNVVKFGLAHDVRVPAHGRAILDLALHTPNSDGVQLWRTQAHDDTEAPCALVATGRQDQPFESFSRPDDQDCDAAMPECDPYGVFGSLPATDDRLSCVLVPSTIDCELGGVACMDGVASSTTCGEPTDPWCLPSSMCGPIANCRQTDATCFSSLLHTIVTPVLRCVFPLGTAQMPCVSSDLQALVDLTPIGPTCNDVKVAALAAPLAWQSSAFLAPNDTKFSISSFDNNHCTFMATITEPADLTRGSVGLIEVKTADNPTAHHVIPILVSHEGVDCVVVPHCDSIAPTAADDSLFKCR
jgi:hypothetical protein